MNKNSTFDSIKSRFFTERFDLEHEIELKTEKHKQMLPRLRIIVNRSMKMKISFITLLCYCFCPLLCSYVRGWGFLLLNFPNNLIFD